jgi:hypothetical protein
MTLTATARGVATGPRSLSGDLKACPFCASEAKFKPLHFETARHPSMPDLRQCIEPDGPGFVRCTFCGTSTKLYDTRAEAEAAWNRRTVPLMVSKLPIAPLSDTSVQKMRRQG